MKLRKRLKLRLMRSAKRSTGGTATRRRKARPVLIGRADRLREFDGSLRPSLVVLSAS
jgi:hypothetical protein